LPHRVRPFIIAQTANVTEEFRQGCLQAGMGTCFCGSRRVAALFLLSCVCASVCLRVLTGCLLL
jgi:hypothetical protein